MFLEFCMAPYAELCNKLRRQPGTPTNCAVPSPKHCCIKTTAMLGTVLGQSRSDCSHVGQDTDTAGWGVLPLPHIFDKVHKRPAHQLGQHTGATHQLQQTTSNS